MSLELVRVDDRLIHGQVVVGWGQVINPDLFVIVDDEVAQHEWEQDIYRLGVPAAQEVEFTSVSEAAESVERWANSSRRTTTTVSQPHSSPLPTIRTRKDHGR